MLGNDVPKLRRCAAQVPIARSCGEELALRILRESNVRSQQQAEREERLCAQRSPTAGEYWGGFVEGPGPWSSATAVLSVVAVGIVPRGIIAMAMTIYGSQRI